MSTVGYFLGYIAHTSSIAPPPGFEQFFKSRVPRTANRINIARAVQQPHRVDSSESDGYDTDSTDTN